MAIADKLIQLNTTKQNIKQAIIDKGVDVSGVSFIDYHTKIAEISGEGTVSPSTGGSGIFTGATIPLTYKDNIHEYENVYEYKSSAYNITISGLEGRATIEDNGTGNVVVSFDTSSNVSSLKNFTITCEKGTQVITYKGLHAHYGEEITGILTFAYMNITPDGSEGEIGTNYKFITTTKTTLPLFTSSTFLWNTIYSYQVLNILLGNYSATSIGDGFLHSCYSFNQPLTIPASVTSIGDYFLYNCYSFNQPLTIPSSVTSIGDDFLYNCYSLSILIYNAATYPTDDNSLSQTLNTKPASSGIIIYGTKRAELMAALPKRTSYPYRKLINGGN